MKNKKQLSLMALGVFALSATAQEPIIQTKYTADPAPMVYNDTIFLYTSHDEDDAQGYEFKMLDWQLYTSTDMVNWTDHGPVASLKEFAWRKRDNGAWAQQVVERNGKFYMYSPSTGTASAYWFPIRPMDHLKTLSENRLYGNKNIGKTLTRLSGLTMTDKPICTGVTRTCIM